MGAAVLHLASIDLELDFVGRFGAGKNDPANDKSFGGKRDRKLLAGRLLRQILDSIRIVEKSRFSSHQLGWARLSCVRRVCRARITNALRHGRRVGGNRFIFFALFGLSECEFETPLAVRHGGEAIIRGVDQRASDGFVSHAVDYDAANAVGRLFFRLRALCMGGRCGRKKQQGQEDFEAWMKVVAHTKSEEQADPRQLFFQIPPSRGLHFALHYKAIGRVCRGQLPTSAW